MKIRSIILSAAALLLAASLMPGAIAADLTDVAYVDQADVANLPVFVNANRQLAGFKAQLDAQYNAQVAAREIRRRQAAHHDAVSAAAQRQAARDRRAAFPARAARDRGGCRSAQHVGRRRQAHRDLRRPRHHQGRRDDLLEPAGDLAAGGLAAAVGDRLRRSERARRHSEGADRQSADVAVRERRSGSSTPSKMAEAKSNGDKQQVLTAYNKVDFRQAGSAAQAAGRRRRNRRPPTSRERRTCCSSSIVPTSFMEARTSRRMSRMSSRNSAAALIGMLTTLGAAAVLPSGCGVNVHSAAIRGTGYVRLDEVVKHHPLYPQLSQIDDAIAAINLQSSGPHVPLTARQIATQTAKLNSELRAAQDRANKIFAQKQRDYTRREQQAVASALAAAGVSGAGALASQQMSGASAVQAQQAAQAANADFQAYQQSVISQDNAATNSIANQLQTQASQKYRAKAEQLQQNETDLSLRLTQQDAGARLAIKMRLSNLAMDPEARKQAQQQLAAINAKEAAQVNALRSTDAATLRAYKAQFGSRNLRCNPFAGRKRSPRRRRRNSKSTATRSERSCAVSAPATACSESFARRPRANRRDPAAVFDAQFQADAGKTHRRVQCDESRSRPPVRGHSRGRRRRDRGGRQGTQLTAETTRRALRTDRRSGRARRDSRRQGSRASASFSSTFRPPPAATI